MDYEQYEKECDEVRKENVKYLNLFEEDLRSSGLKDATIRRHIKNTSFYINIFLLRERIIPAEDGIYELDMYFGEFFIRHCAWSTPGTIKTSAASLKKFYKCMSNHGFVSANDYEALCHEIKISMPYWQDLCEQFNDPYAPNPFNPFSYFGGL